MRLTKEQVRTLGVLGYSNVVTEIDVSPVNAVHRRGDDIRAEYTAGTETRHVRIPADGIMLREEPVQ